MTIRNFFFLGIVIATGLLIFIGRYKNKSYVQLVVLTREEKDAIIEQALAVSLEPSSVIICPQVQKIDDAITAKVHEAHYEEAIALTLEGLKKFPDDFTLQADLAGLIGDTSEITPSPLKERMIERSKQMFDKLLLEAPAQSKEAYYPFKNEYYYRFAQYHQQYELGLERVNEYWGTDKWDSMGVKGYYSQGVGAVYYAKQLLKRGDKALALEYAQKSLVAWAQYFSYNNTYYNSYVHYALALGILGYHQEMMRALQHSAQMINKDLDYFEFKDVIDFIESYKLQS